MFLSVLHNTAQYPLGSKHDAVKITKMKLCWWF